MKRSNVAAVFVRASCIGRSVIPCRFGSFWDFNLTLYFEDLAKVWKQKSKLKVISDTWEKLGSVASSDKKMARLVGADRIG